MRTTALILTALLLSGPALAQTAGHGSMNHGTMNHGTMNHGTMNHGTMKHDGMSEGVHAAARVNTISGRTVNVTHGPIPEIGWPAMTMDLQLLEGAEVGAVSAGDDATMMLEKGPDGLYGIRALVPAK